MNRNTNRVTPSSPPPVTIMGGTGGRGPGARPTPPSPSSNWRSNLMLLLVVIVLVPANFALLSGMFNKSDSTSSTNSADQHHIAVRHVYHRQPDEVWTVDAKERNVRGRVSTEGELGEEDSAPEVAEEHHDQEVAYDPADLAKPGKEAVEEDSVDGGDATTVINTNNVEEKNAPEPSEAAGDDDEEEMIEEEMNENNVEQPVAKAGKSKPIVTEIYEIGSLMPALQQQIEGTRKSPKTFVYFRSKSCPYLCSRAKATGWSPGALDFVNKIFPDLLLIRWTVYGKYQHLTKTVVNQVGTGSSCIGGGKGIQLLCRQQLAARHGCDYGDLGLQPKQWNLQKQPQCEDFFLTAAQPLNVEKIWIMKPGGSFHGRGITLHRGDDSSLRTTYGDCRRKLPDGIIVQEYVMNPALMGGHKFDLRTYLLIASTKPFLVFYHDGFARRSEKPFSIAGKNLTDPLAHVTNDARQSSENHFFGFHQLERVLIKEHGFPSDYMEKHFRPKAMRVTNFLFQTSVDRSGHKIEPRFGRYQFFALDWMIDSKGDIHLLEGNGDPSVKHYPDTGLTPVLWDSMYELVEKIHFTPQELGPGVQVARKFYYKGWRLVYNELEAAAEPYQACKINQYAKTKHPLYSYEN